MVRVQSQITAGLGNATLGSHMERFAAAVAELVFALRAREVYAAATRQREAEFAFRTIDAVHLQMLVDALRLRLGIVGRLPVGELIARDSFVLGLPLECISYHIDCKMIEMFRTNRFVALRTRHRTAVRTDEPLLARPCNESGRTLDTPLEIRILFQGAIAKLLLEQIVHSVVQNRSQQHVQLAKVVEHIVLAHDVVFVHLGQLAVRTRAVVEAALGDLNGEIVAGAVLATAVFALQHRDELGQRIAAGAQFALLLQQVERLFQRVALAGRPNSRLQRKFHGHQFSGQLRFQVVGDLAVGEQTARALLCVQYCLKLCYRYSSQC